MTDQPREPGEGSPTEPAATAPSAQPAAPSTAPIAPPTTPVTTGSLQGKPRNGLRWGIALLVVAIVAAAASAAFFLLSGRAAASPMLGYAPSGSLMYVEIRGDLPGDQRQHLGAFRSAGYLTVTDGARAQAWLKEQLGGATSSTEAYDGIQLTVVQGSSPIKVAYGVDASMLVVGDLNSVKASLDARRHQSGRTSLADDANVKQALAALPADHLVFGFVDSGRLLEWSRRMGQGAGSAAMPDFSACSPAGPVTWGAFSLRADGKTIRMDSIEPTSTSRVKLTRTTSRVAPRLPGNTIVQIDVHDVGTLALGTLEACRKVPEIAKALADVDKTVGALGGWDGLLGWIGDTDIVVTKDGTTIAGGLIGVAADKAGAARIVTQLRNLLALSGSTQVAIKDEDYGGTTITTISSRDETVIGTSTSVAVAVRDDLVVIGIGTDFVKHVLDVKAGASLADQDRYKQAIGRVETSNEQQAFIDVSAVRAAIESAAPAGTVPAQYQTDIKPYLEPLDLIVGSTSTTDDLVRAAFVLVVK